MVRWYQITGARCKTPAEAKGDPYSKCMVCREKMPSNRVEKEEHILRPAWPDGTQSCVASRCNPNLGRGGARRCSSTRCSLRHGGEGEGQAHGRRIPWPRRWWCLRVWRKVAKGIRRCGGGPPAVGEKGGPPAMGLHGARLGGREAPG